MPPRSAPDARVHARGLKRRVARHARRGFTLVEIIVVVTIIALLATLVAPRVIGQLGGAKIKVAQTEVKAIENAVNLYAANTGITITDDFELDVLLLGPDQGGAPEGPYLKKEDDLIDPWGNRYEIQYPPDVNPDFDIVSYGPDGQLGTEDDIIN